VTRSFERADTWRAHLDDRLDTITAAMLDLIDVGVPSAPAAARHPSRRERVATDRADGDFRPTVRASSSRSVYGDPTGGDVLSWEAEVQDATTRLYGAVTVAQEVADGLSLTPTGEGGRRLVAPVEPPTRTTLAGNHVVDVSPAGCRSASLAAVAYVGAVADQLAGRMAEAPVDSADGVASRAHWLEAAVGQLAFRLAPPPPRMEPADSPRKRPCSCDWSECPHGPGRCVNETPDRTCSTCRHRKTAARKAAS
jgi:hypothetical protein